MISPALKGKVVVEGSVCCGKTTTALKLAAEAFSTIESAAENGVVVVSNEESSRDLARKLMLDDDTKNKIFEAAVFVGVESDHSFKTVLELIKEKRPKIVVLDFPEYWINMSVGLREEDVLYSIEKSTDLLIATKTISRSRELLKMSLHEVLQ